MRIIKQRTLEAQYNVSLEGGRLNGVGNIYSLLQSSPATASCEVPTPRMFRAFSLLNPSLFCYAAAKSHLHC